MRLPPLAACVLAFSCLGAATTRADDYDLSWNTLDGGGGTSVAGEFELCGTIGQMDAGPPLANGEFALTGGFRGGAATPVPPCPGDVDESGAVDFDDLLRILAAWGDCPDCPEDLNDDGTVDFDDLLAVLSGWGPCP